MYSIHEEVLSTSDKTWTKEVNLFFSWYLDKPPFEPAPVKFLIIETRDKNMYLLCRATTGPTPYKRWIVVDAAKNKGRSLETATGPELCPSIMLSENGWIEKSVFYFNYENGSAIRDIIAITQVYGDNLHPLYIEPLGARVTNHLERFRSLLKN